MLDPFLPLRELLSRDRRYAIEAYLFVFEALEYAQDVLELGQPQASEPLPDEAPPTAEGEDDPDANRHLTGQELCEAIRQFALEQFGYMAKCVLNSWGIYETGDFGEIVFNLIEIRKMRKTPNDRREDFDNVFDFETDLQQRFQITLPE